MAGTSGAGEGVSVCDINHAATFTIWIGGEVAVGGVMGTAAPLRQGVFYHDDTVKWEIVICDITSWVQSIVWGLTLVYM